MIFGTKLAHNQYLYMLEEFEVLSTRQIQSNQARANSKNMDESSQVWGQMHEGNKSREESTSGRFCRKAGITWSPPNLKIFQKYPSKGLEMQVEQWRV